MDNLRMYIVFEFRMIFITQNCEFQLSKYDTPCSTETLRLMHDRDTIFHFTTFLKKTNVKKVTESIENLKLESATGF